MRPIWHTTTVQAFNGDQLLVRMVPPSCSDVMVGYVFNIIRVHVIDNSEDLFVLGYKDIKELQRFVFFRDGVLLVTLIYCNRL